MSQIFQTLLRNRKLYSYRKPLAANFRHKKPLHRKYSAIPENFETFDEVVAARRLQAARSLVVQVQSDASFKELYGYCSRNAEISSIHHYSNSADEHFMLIEFASEDNLKDVLQTCSGYHKDREVISSQSPFLWFRATSGKKEKLTIPSDVSLSTKFGSNTINEDKLFEDLLKCSTVSEQMQCLYDKTVLNDIGIRLRYMVARQLEVTLQGLYSNLVVRSFGSSVNGFGSIGSDLDLVLTNVISDEMSSPHRRLIYHDKRGGAAAAGATRHLQLAADALELRAPGAARVTRILNARVPIVKYAHEYAGIECDVCFGNMSGVHMSELLWLWGAADARGRPLTLAVRRWARAAGLTAPHPGRWLTNFSLTLMVVFFLQQPRAHETPLPTYKQLVELADKKDVRVAEDGLDCTFCRDPRRLPPAPAAPAPAPVPLETLLLQFFEFYSQFDFNDKAISVVEGAAVRKPSSQPLHIVNPLDRGLNVSRNVSAEECARVAGGVRAAAWALEGAAGAAGAGAAGAEAAADWGLLALLERGPERRLRRLLRVGNSHRLVSVRDLFRDGGEEAPEAPAAAPAAAAAAAPAAAPAIKYKSEATARAVHRIRREKWT